MKTKSRRVVALVLSLIMVLSVLTVMPVQVVAYDYVASFNDGPPHPSAVTIAPGQVLNILNEPSRTPHSFQVTVEIGHLHTSFAQPTAMLNFALSGPDSGDSRVMFTGASAVGMANGNIDANVGAPTIRVHPDSQLFDVSNNLSPVFITDPQRLFSSSGTNGAPDGQLAVNAPTNNGQTVDAFLSLSNAARDIMAFPTDGHAIQSLAGTLVLEISGIAAAADFSRITVSRVGVQGGSVVWVPLPHQSFPITDNEQIGVLIELGRTAGNLMPSMDTIVATFAAAGVPAPSQETLNNLLWFPQYYGGSVATITIVNNQLLAFPSLPAPPPPPPILTIPPGQVRNPRVEPDRTPHSFYVTIDMAHLCLSTPVAFSYTMLNFILTGPNYGNYRVMFTGASSVGAANGNIAANISAPTIRVHPDSQLFSVTTGRIADPQRLFSSAGPDGVPDGLLAVNAPTDNGQAVDSQLSLSSDAWEIIGHPAFHLVHGLFGTLVLEISGIAAAADFPRITVSGGISSDRILLNNQLLAIPSHGVNITVDEVRFSTTALWLPEIRITERRAQSFHQSWLVGEPQNGTMITTTYGRGEAVNHQVRLLAPRDFEWDADGIADLEIVGNNVFSTAPQVRVASQYIDGATGRPALVLKISVPERGMFPDCQRIGQIYLRNLFLIPTHGNVPQGEIIIDVSFGQHGIAEWQRRGPSWENQNIVVGYKADSSLTFSVYGDIPTLISGQLNFPDSNWTHSGEHPWSDNANNNTVSGSRTARVQLIELVPSAFDTGWVKSVVELNIAPTAGVQIMHAAWRIIASENSSSGMGWQHVSMQESITAVGEIVLTPETLHLFIPRNPNPITERRILEVVFFVSIIDGYDAMFARPISITALGNATANLGANNREVIIAFVEDPATVSLQWQNEWYWGIFDNSGELIEITYQSSFGIQTTGIPWDWEFWLGHNMYVRGLPSGATLLEGSISSSWDFNYRWMELRFDGVPPQGLHELTLYLYVPDFGWINAPFQLPVQQDEASIRYSIMTRPWMHVEYDQIGTLTSGTPGMAIFPIRTRNIPDGRLVVDVHYWATQADVDAGLAEWVGQNISLEHITGIYWSEFVYIHNNMGFLVIAVSSEAESDVISFCVDVYLPGDIFYFSGTRYLTIEPRDGGQNITHPTGGVTFDYITPQRHHRPEISVNLNASANIHMHVAPTPEAWASNFATLHFVWLRNGEPWTGIGLGGVGTVPAAQMRAPGFTGIRLDLPGRLTQSERGGEWVLRITLLDYDGDVLFADYSRVTTVAVTTPPGQQPPVQQPPVQQPPNQPPPTQQPPGAGSYYDYEPTSTPTRPSAPVVNNEPEQNLIPVNESSPVIREAIENAEAGEVPIAVFRLDDGEAGVSVSGEDIQALVENNGQMVVSTSLFTIGFSSSQLAALQIPSGSEATFILALVDGMLFHPLFRPIHNPVFNQRLTFSLLRLASAGQLSTISLNELLMAEMVEAAILIDGEPVNTDISAIVSLDVSGFDMSLIQRERLRGVAIYRDSDEWNYALQAGGTLDGDYFRFPISTTGLYGVLSENTAIEMRFIIGNPVYLLDGVSLISILGVPFIDEISGRTMVPLRLIAESLNAEVDWIHQTRTVTIVRGSVDLTLPIDAPIFIGNEYMGRPIIQNDRTFVPIRYVSEVLGAFVLWDEDARAVYVFE